MEWVEVRDAKGELVWKSPELEHCGIDQVGDTVKVFDLDSSQIVAGYILMPGQRVLTVESGETANPRPLE